MASEQKQPTEAKGERAKSPASPKGSPTHHAHLQHGLHTFKIPSPLPTKRTRTTSQSRIASESPEQTGICRTFCREKGHGFITPDEPGKDIFVHISDIEGEYVLKEGDRVSFRTCPLPPKNTEKQAVEVVITEMHGPHDKWWSNTSS